VAISGFDVGDDRRADRKFFKIKEVTRKRTEERKHGRKGDVLMKRYFIAILIITLTAGCAFLSGCGRKDAKEEAKVDAKVENTIDAKKIPEIKKIVDADMVIIGGGGAGVTAALSAIQGGVKKVILLEKQSYLGGTSATAGGHLWASDGVKSNNENAFNQHMEFNGNTGVDPKVVRTFIERSTEMIKWLNDNGIAYTGAGNAYMPVDNISGTRNFARTIEKLAARFTDKGGMILLDTRAEKILRDTEGKISGVIATDDKGEGLQINTKTVMLASGGFTGDNKMLYKYFPEKWQSEVWVTEAVRTNTGDGIKMAEEAGAGLNDFATLIDHLNHYSFFNGETDWANRVAYESANMAVNKRGERFDRYSGKHLAQPDKTIYYIFDENKLQSLNNKLKAQGETHDIKEFYKRYDQQQVWVKISSKWDDIASWIGADPKALKATVAAYNASCKQESGAEQGSSGYPVPGATEAGSMPPMPTQEAQPTEQLLNPPYYAVKCTPLMIDTYGPVRINERMQVLDKKDNPIPGFYAGGAICGQIHGYEYNFHGSALGFAVTSGLIAAENAATYISGK
jgi:fumarate reductase flavoprotein subunit